MVIVHVWPTINLSSFVVAARIFLTRVLLIPRVLPACSNISAPVDSSLSMFYCGVRLKC